MDDFTDEIPKPHERTAGISSEELNEAFQYLSLAIGSYDPNGHDHGRRGVRNALIAVIRLLAVVLPNAPILPLPLNRLVYALADLDRGKVEPLLKPTKVGNSPGNSLIDELFKALPAAALTCLMKKKDGLGKAADEIARRLSELGYKYPGRALKLITGERLMNWREKLEVELPRENLAAAQYKFALKTVEGQSPDEAVDYLIKTFVHLHPAQAPKSPPWQNSKKGLA